MVLAEPTPAEAVDELARRNLGDYAISISPDTYEQPAQVSALIGHLGALERREIRRLIVEMPPRSSKSTHVSRLFPSWWLGRHPTDGVIVASYGQELATEHGRAVRDLLTHPRYPFATRLRSDVKAAGRWQTDKGGGLITAGVGTGLTGFGGDLNVLDDPIKGREEAESEIVREHTWSWYQDVFSTRWMRDSAVVVMGTRWHEDDPIGRILNTEGASDWTRLRIPYLAEQDDPLGRREGEALDVFGNVPLVEKGEISAYGFSALYQQRPTPAGGGVFKAEWMQRRYCVGHDGAACPKDAKPLAERYPRWRNAQTVDIGGKQGVGHDPSAIATWGYDGITLYVLDYWSSQAEYADIKPKFAAKWHEWRGFKGGNPHLMHIEDATWAQPLISDLNRETGVLVAAVTPWGSKWVRADAAAPVFQAGRVALPCQAPWLDGWMHEHLSFPNALHDEAVDTTSMAVRELREIGATMPTHTISGKPLSRKAS
jgi:predicted phage terminase large subunit-like protein